MVDMNDIPPIKEVQIGSSTFKVKDYRVFQDCDRLYLDHAWANSPTPEVPIVICIEKVA